MGVSPAVQSIPTSVLLQHLKETLSAVNSQHSEASLRRRENQLKYVLGTPKKAYIDQQTELRELLLQSDFPEIESDQTTSQFVINELYDAPEFASLLRVLDNYQNLHKGKRPPSTLSLPC